MRPLRSQEATLAGSRRMCAAVGVPAGNVDIIIEHLDYSGRSLEPLALAWVVVRVCMQNARRFQSPSTDILGQTIHCPANAR